MSRKKYDSIYVENEIYNKKGNIFSKNISCQKVTKKLNVSKYDSIILDKELYHIDCQNTPYIIYIDGTNGDEFYNIKLDNPVDGQILEFKNNIKNKKIYIELNDIENYMKLQYRKTFWEIIVSI